jgi:GT2 family glycosyltransferase
MSARERIGCAIITYNRPDSLLRLYASIPRERLDYFVIINDGQAYPEFDTLDVDEFVQHETNLGVGKSKNDAFRRLLAQGVEHIFLIEDDIYLTGDRVFDRYIEASKASGIHHFNYSQHGLNNKTKQGRLPNPNAVANYSGLKIEFFPYCVGAFSYYSRYCLDIVGLMDEEYHNAMEHVDHTLRVILADLHPSYYFFADVFESWRYFGEDEWSIEQSSISSQSNHIELYNKAKDIFYRKHHDFMVVCRPDFNNFQSSLERILRSSNLLAESASFSKQVAVRALDLLDNLDETQRLRHWLERRKPVHAQTGLIEKTFSENDCGRRFGIVIRDRAGNLSAVAETLKSLDADRNLYSDTRVLVLTACAVPPDYSSDELRFIELASSDWITPLNKALNEWPVDWIMRVDAGDEFAAAGLQILALELIGATQCKAVYGDLLYRDSQQHLTSAFRPGFSLDYLLSLPQVMSRYWMFKRDQIFALDGFDPAYGDAAEFDLILRLIEAEGLAGIAHVDEVLLTCGAPKLVDSHQEQAVVLRHLQARGYTDAGVDKSAYSGCYRVRYRHPLTPLVSILLLAEGALDGIKSCLESVLECTGYPNYEVLLAAPSGADSSVLDWLSAITALDEARLRVVDQVANEGSATLRNRMGSLAQGEYLAFLDAGVRITQNDWLDALLEHAQRPEVAAVAPRLNYPTGELRHGGIVLGLRGGAGEAFVGEAGDASGYLWRLQVDQNYSAVSSACLVVSKDIFLSVDGFSGDLLSEEYRDVDFGLKCGQAGLLNVWTPHVQLPRGHLAPPGVAREEGKALLFERWLPHIARDPAYNQNLRLQGFGFEPDHRKAREWQFIGPKSLPRVLCHPSDASGCGQYRIRQPFLHMQEQQLVDGAIIADHLPSAVELERFQPDVIVYQRQIGIQGLLQRQEGRLFKNAFRLADCDDYAFEVPDKSLHKKHLPSDIKALFKVSLSMVDRLVVSTQPLAEALSGLHPDIRIQPNYLPRAWWGALESTRGQGRKPRVGWAGGTSHTGDLELLTEVVRELAAEVEWVFMGMCPDGLRPYVHEFHPAVSIAEYPRRLAALGLDLALAPLEDHLFNRCKTHLRQLEYGACAYPVICSDVFPFRESGLPVTLVANTTEHWLDAIRMHLSDPGASAAAGERLREAVLRDWMLEGENLEQWRKAWMP